MGTTTPPCRVCASSTEPAGTKFSEFSRRGFSLAHCPTCRYSFVVDPRLDFDQIYDAAYYAGEGADPHVSYTDAVDRGRSVLEYEWRGIVRILEDAGILRPEVRWLDYGCGLGGLLRYARGKGYDVAGFDEGYAASRLRAEGLPSFTRAELDELNGEFDIVTAIEVVEHVVDPIEAFGQMARVLRPGGALFVTTGNARPFRGRLSSWQYVRPDVHVGFFEPSTLELCMTKVGLEPAPTAYRAGYTNLIRSKILRTLGVNRQNALEKCVPWALLSRIADRRFGVSRQPMARRPQ